MKTILICFSIFLLAIITGCSSKQNLNLVSYSGFIQGTTFMIRYYGGNDSIDLFRRIDSVFLLVDHTASLFDSGSMINMVNINRDMEVNPLFVCLLSRSREISEETDGAFDVTIRPLVKAWGFYQHQGKNIPQLVVDSLKRCIGYKNISIEGKKVVKKFPEVQLDFNAIAQGYTVDLVAQLLERQGINDYLVEIGGEVRASGMKSGNTPWMIGIERPSNNDSSERVIQQLIKLDGMSVATSGSYRNYFISDGRKYSHTLNPATGYPVKHNLMSVSVIADDCMTADAYATACMVMGLDRSKLFLKSHPGTEAYFIYSDIKGKMITYWTPGFTKLLVDNQ